MRQKFKRLYIFTGKGGVGKTTLSLAFTRWLIKQGQKAQYVSLSPQMIGDDPKGDSRLPEGWSDVPHWHVTLEDSAQDYIIKKLGSGMIAKWIVKTAFFRALVNMLPGFGYVISLGHILEKLIHGDGIVVLDAPASGHALTMLESTSNFRDIFQSGLIFDDTQKMLARLNDPEFTAIRIMTLPSAVAIQEAVELQVDAQALMNHPPQIFLNYTLLPWKADVTDAPASIQHKWRLEEEVTGRFDQQVKDRFPFSSGLTSAEVYRDLEPKLQGLV